MGIAPAARRSSLRLLYRLMARELEVRFHVHGAENLALPNISLAALRIHLPSTDGHFNALVAGASQEAWLLSAALILSGDRRNGSTSPTRARLALGDRQRGHSQRDGDNGLRGSTTGAKRL